MISKCRVCQGSGQGLYYLPFMRFPAALQGVVGEVQYRARRDARELKKK